MHPQPLDLTPHFTQSHMDDLTSAYKSLCTPITEESVAAYATFLQQYVTDLSDTLFDDPTHPLYNIASSYLEHILSPTSTNYTDLALSIISLLDPTCFVYADTSETVTFMITVGDTLHEV